MLLNLNKQDNLDLHWNVQIVSKNKETGLIEDVRIQHNVFTNMGRTWLRNLLSTAAYGTPDTYHESNRPKFLAVGTSGAFNGGSYRECTQIRCIESPTRVTAVSWYKQLYPQPSLLDTDYFPTDYILRLRTVFTPSDISYAGAVEVSEMAMFTTAYNGLLEPGVGTLPGGADGMIAYTIFSPVTKTADNIIEAAWELRT